MSYKKDDILYHDYKWTANADYDNPTIIGGNDHAQLNRTEGYEMLYFIIAWQKAGVGTTVLNHTRISKKSSG